jgi:hypothetical protein
MASTTEEWSRHDEEKRRQIDGEEELEGTGESLEELAAADEDADALEGTRAQLSWDIGGPPPDTSVLKIAAQTIPLKGQFPKNKRMRLVMDIEIDHVYGKTKRDRDDFIVGHERHHVARIHSAEHEEPLDT